MAPADREPGARKPAVVHCKREPFDVYIGRPGKWGNPFRMRPGRGGRAGAIESYRDWLAMNPALAAEAREELRGKVLGCWCAPRPCHGDVLLEVANAD